MQTANFSLYSHTVEEAKEVFFLNKGTEPINEGSTLQGLHL